MKTAVCLVASCALSSFALGQSVLFTVNGDNANDVFGQCIDIVGDVNHDGYADFMVGAWRDDNNGKTDSGSVRLVSGKDGTTLLVINGDLANDHMGFGSSGAGDVNGDGTPDICAAADEADVGGIVNEGAAKIVSGATGLTLYTVTGDNASDLFGWSSAAAGDIDGDGFADFVVGALQDDDVGKANCGSVTAFSGKTGALIRRVFGFAGGDNLGDTCGGVGDIDGDGKADFVGGAPSADPNGATSGQALVFSGATGQILIGFDGAAAGDSLGGSVSGAGDTNLDGFPDVLIGAPGEDANGANSGSVRVISGATHFVLLQANGDSAGDALGTAVRDAGDVNGDGYPDFMAGATGDDDNGSGCGSVRIYSGKDGSIVRTFFGDSAGDSLGTSVAGGGDMDLDSLSDVVAAAPGDDNNGTGSGSARAYSLRPVGLTLFGTGTPGCAGKMHLSGNGVPQIGNAGFTLIGDHAPGNSVGYLFVSDVANVPGTVLPGVGAILHVALPPVSNVLFIGNTFADAHGSMLSPVPLPLDVALVGFAVSFQALSVWPSHCAGLPLTNVSSSNGLTAVLQP